MQTIAVANQKGGVGKTTIAWNLAAELGGRDLRVLVVDLDSQCNLTKGVGFRDVDPGRTIYQVLVHGAHPDDVIVQSKTADGTLRFDLIPGSRSLNASPSELANQVAREMRLKEALDLVAHRYDVAILDCPPALELPTLNALAAADIVLVPVQTQQWAYDGLGELQQTVAKVRARINPKLRIRHVVPNMLTRSRGVENSFLAAIQEYVSAMGEGIVVHEPIVDNVRVLEIASLHIPLREHDRDNPAADGFERLADSIAEGLRV